MKKVLKLIMICCLFLFSFNSLSSPHSRLRRHSRENGNPAKPHFVFWKGVKLFQKGELKAARTKFESLNYGDPNFVSGLLEIQKINYINKSWDRFFGLALYYRRVLLSTDKLSLNYFRQELLVLETLALMRHCRFQDSKKVIEWSLVLAKQLKKNSSKIKQANHFLSLDQLLNLKKQTKTQSNWKEQIYWWPLDISKLEELDNPKNLRIKVDSQC